MRKTKPLGINMPLSLFIEIGGDRAKLRELLERGMKERNLYHTFGKKITYTLKVPTEMHDYFKAQAELNNMSIKDFVCDLLTGVMEHGEES